MKFKVILLSLFSASLALGQAPLHRHRITASKRHSATAAKVRSTKEYLVLVNRLRSKGATVKLSNERVRQPFFSVAGRIININDEGAQVFIYVTTSAADDQAKLVSPDGMTIGNSKPSWMAPPHFFKSGKVIVLYVGANESILTFLQTSLGAQFAGS